VQQIAQEAAVLQRQGLIEAELVAQGGAGGGSQSIKGARARRAPR
jgi:hypothetical protein